MGFAPVSGNDGRVRSGGATGARAPVAGMNKWDITKTTAAIAIPHFEMDADGDGNLWPGQLRGLSGATGTASGFINTDPADATDSGTPGLSNGLFVLLDLILVKGTPWGIPSLPVLITEIKIGSDINNQGSPYSMNFTVSGVAGKTQAVT